MKILLSTSTAILVLYSALLATAQPNNLFNPPNLEIVCEAGVVATSQKANEKHDLLITSAASKRSPSIYFGSVKVAPGKEYTYFVKGTKKASCKIYLYIVGSGRNILWPGAELKNGVARSTFTIPKDIDELTLAITFLYPQLDDSVNIQTIGLFKGNIETWPAEAKETDFRDLRHKNLISSDHLMIICEDGIAASNKKINGKNYLKVRSAPSTKAPSIYLATIKVTPGTEYTYILRTMNQNGGRVLSYITSPKGNVVWPGGELKNGMAHTFFSVPPDVEEITLAATFLYPGKTDSIIIQDLGLFQGYVSEWQPRSNPADFSSLFRKSHPFAKWFLAMTFALLFAVILYDYKETTMHKWI